jgi:alpha/beta superfamily hydrolase
MPIITDLHGPAGRLEALIDDPAAGTPVRAAVVFAHPHPEYGGTMHTKVVYQSAKALARIRCAVLRFNFRGVGASQGDFDRGPGEQADFRAALDYMAVRHPGKAVWAAGFSFGAWVALETGALDARVRVLIGIAPPVVTSVSGQEYDFTNTLASTKPKFFVQGESDEVCPIEGMWQFYGRLQEPKELVVIDAADHLFEGRAQEVGEALEDLLADFEPE